MFATFDRFAIQLTKAQAAQCSHSGHCDDDVLALSKVPAVRRQLAKLDPAELRAELQDYGAWDESELEDHAQNLQRILWIAAGNIADGGA